MILLVVVRRGVCELCGGQFDLEPGSEVPEKCPKCGSKVWQFGRNNRVTRLIRQGIAFNKRKLNPGAKSKKRQDRAKKQWRQFKPKPEDSGDAQSKG